MSDAVEIPFIRGSGGDHAVWMDRVVVENDIFWFRLPARSAGAHGGGMAAVNAALPGR